MESFDKYFKYENNTVTCGLTDELNVFYVLNLFKKEKKNIILLTSSLYEANNYFNLLQTYTSDILLFVMDDFLSSIINTSSPELKLTRLNTLEKIDEKPHIIVTNLMGYLKYLPSIKDKDKRVLRINKNDEIKRSLVIDKLHELGYKKESLTTSTGEYSVRGMIIDVFLINEQHPIRIEFDGDEINSIRYYNEDTQASTDELSFVTLKPISEISDKDHSSLYEYANNPIVIKIDDDQIMASYKNLVNEIINYNEKNQSTDKYMFELNEINPNYELYLNHFAKNKNDILIKSGSIDNFNQNFQLLKDQVEKWINEGYKVNFCLTNEKQIAKIKDLIPNANIVKKKINKGFIISNLVFICEYDIENTKHNYKYQNNFYGGKKITSYSELNKGDYVVHIAHGIGIYNGIVTLTKDGVKKDYIQIQYANNDKIYVPATKITNIYKYSDKEGITPKLNRLNSSSWLKTRSYVQRKVEDISKELMMLYQKRIGIKSTAYKSYPEEDMFGSEFNFDLTTDQSKAINDIFMDLTSSHPMDRLLCGDVGFGKTEVALRSMFKTVLNNEQVMYLCPTTILSKQQYNVALERFKLWPVEIGLLNRFTTKKEEQRILEGLEKGTVDIVFGTHKLLNDKVKFKNLGLMVVDEEQRFGVKHKEKIKQYKNDVNVLTLSATPIPRTLKLALSGLRDLSIIDSAPQNRYPVQTYVINEDDYIIKDAIYKELARGGQVFILYNKVEDIEKKVFHLKNLIPNEEIRYIHGQMNKDDIENIMDDFINRKFNIIVCTTIIENGIDIPNANTLIVYDADRLGLAQLYQLRGRVGRSDKVAYAYLMYNQNKMLNDVAIKRLQAIKEFTELGSGYKIAMRDLSIRGSGDIFGSSQAGFVDSVGISLYMKLIEDEMKRLKGEDVEELEEETPLLNVESHIADDYVDDEDIKIEIHSLINEIDSYETLEKVKRIIEDRFGKVNEQIEDYMYEEWFEKLAKKFKISNVKQTDRLVQIIIPPEVSSTIKGDKLLYTSMSLTRNFNFEYKRGSIIITLYYKTLKEHFVRYLVKLLSAI